jgi:predicted RNase H-like HicB family nuclease
LPNESASKGVIIGTVSDELTIIIEPCEEGGYTAFVPEVPGAVSEGETPEEAKAMVLDALNELMAFRREKAVSSLAKGAVVTSVPRAS